MLISFVPFKLKSQTAATRIWSVNSGLTDTALVSPMVTDHTGNVYIAATVINATSGTDILLTKLDEHGQFLWDTTYTGSGNYRDMPTAICIDSSFNVYISGFSYVSSHNFDMLVLKFSSSGGLVFSQTLNGTLNQADVATGIATDSGNVYVCGAIANTGSTYDYVTAKYNSSGTLQWSKSYNYNNWQDIPFDIDVHDGNVWTTGGSQTSLNNWDYAILQYSAGGTASDTTRITGTGFGFDHAAQAVTDAHYIYVTGTFANGGNGMDYKTVKLDAQGNIHWVKTYNNSGVNDTDYANSVTVDFNGNVFVTGESKNGSGNYDYCTIKYDSTGTQQWVMRYHNTSHDRAKKICVDAEGNSYITGESYNGNNYDFRTIAYDTSGTELWNKTFNGHYNGNDRAMDIEERSGMVYVSGFSWTGAAYEYITIAYGQSEFRLPPDLSNESPGTNAWYYTQEGQILNDTGEVAEIDYYSNYHTPIQYYKNTDIHYVWSKIDTSHITNDTIVNIKMSFVDPLNNDKMYAYKQSTNYLNYFLGHIPNGIIDIYGNSYLKAEQVYYGVDVYISSNGAGEKQLFLFSPGAKLNDFKINYIGADSINNDTITGLFTIYSVLGNLNYDQLMAYEIDATGTIIPGTQQAINFVLDTIAYTYKLPSIVYNQSNNLVIERKLLFNPPSPQSSIDNLLWSSFYGQAGVTELLDVDNDNSGNAYYTGRTSSFNFPVVSGTTISALTGNMDAITIKLNNGIEPQWTTFFGGSQSNLPTTEDDIANTVEVSDNGDRIYIGGQTTSIDLPINSNSGAFWYDDYNDGNCSNNYDCQEAFITRIDNNGYVVWSTYFGEGGPESFYGLSLDGDNSIYAVGLRNSNSLLYNAGSYNSGNGLFIKFDSDNQLLWSKAWKAKVIHDVVTDTDDNFYFTGWTRSNDMDVLNFDPNFDGGATENYTGNFDDVFVTKFEANGSLSYSFYYGGSCNDRAFSIDRDNNNNIYVAGTTLFQGPSPSTPCYCSEDLFVLNGFPFTLNQTNNPQTDVFLLKIAAHTSGDVEILNSGYYGGGAEETGYQSTSANSNDITSTGLVINDISLSVKTDGTIFIGGISKSYGQSLYTEPTIQLPANQPQNFYVNPDLNHSGAGMPQNDAFIAALSTDFDLLWATYFGGRYSDYITGMSYSNADERLFICGYTLSTYNGNDFDLTPYNTGLVPEHYQNYNSITAADWPSFAAMFDVSGINITNTKNNFHKQPSVFPNPTNNILNIQYSQSFNSYRIVDLLGNEVQMGSLMNYGPNLCINVSFLSKGIYILYLQNNIETESIKFVKN